MGKKKAPVKEPEVPLDRKALVYDQLAGLTRGRAMLLLSDILLEIMQGDTTVNVSKVQELAPEITRLATMAAWQDLVYLLLSGSKFQIENRLFADATQKEGSRP